MDYVDSVRSSMDAQVSQYVTVEVHARTSTLPVDGQFSENLDLLWKNFYARKVPRCKDFAPQLF